MTAAPPSPELVFQMLQRLLPALWLRPERALWDAHELATIGTLIGPSLPERSLEYGCTEGTNTFAMLGGTLNVAYDDYEGIWEEIKGTSSPHRPGDFFDYAKERVTPIQRHAIGKFALGLSWKESHLRRARAFDIYRDLALAPLDQPIDNIGAASYDLIWAPNLFWSKLESLPPLLREMRRVMSPGARLLTIFPSEDQPRFTLLARGPSHLRPWLEKLDRGKFENLTRFAQPLASWEETFSNTGLRVTQVQRFLPAMSGLVYEIGLRPLFPALLALREKLLLLEPEHFLSLKEEWLSLLLSYLEPFCDVDFSLGNENPLLWYAFELEGA